MKIRIIVVLLLIFPFLFGCKSIHRNTYFLEFQIKNKINNCKINENNNILEIYTDDCILYYDKKGNCVFDSHKIKDDFDSVIIGDNVALEFKEKQKKLHYYDLDDFTERQNRSFYKRAGLDKIKYLNNDNFLFFLDNNKVCKYSFNKRIKYQRINELENSICINSQDGRNLYFITKNKEFYKSDLNKQVPEKLFNIDECVEIKSIAPLGKDGFAIVNNNGLYCYNSKELFYKYEFDKKELINSNDIHISKNAKYVLIETKTKYVKNNKSLTEICSTLFNLKDKKTEWTKGSLFKSIDCYAVSNSGYVYIKENNKIVKYSKDFMPVSEFDFDGNIIKCVSGENCIFVATDKNKVYVINLYPMN